MRGPASFAMALSFLIGFAIADDTPGTEKASPIPTTKLPTHVLAPPGQLTLFADFKNKGALGVPLYLVNRTGEPVDLFTYNGQPFVALQYEAEPGKWKPVRALNYPLCGNDLKPVKVPNETYLIAQGYMAARGFKAKVRYRIDDEAKPLSNAGIGVVSHDDLSYLLLSGTTDFHLLSSVASGQFIPPTESANYRPLAIARLADPRFDRAKAEAVLKMIAEGPDKESAKIAREVLQLRRTFGNK